MYQGPILHAGQFPMRRPERNTFFLLSSSHILVSIPLLLPSLTMSVSTHMRRSVLCTVERASKCWLQSDSVHQYPRMLCRVDRIYYSPNRIPCVHGLIEYLPSNLLGQWWQLYSAIHKRPRPHCVLPSWRHKVLVYSSFVLDHYLMIASLSRSLVDDGRLIPKQKAFRPRFSLSRHVSNESMQRKTSVW